MVKFDKSTRTAAEAAAAIGCSVAQFAKSLIFKEINTDLPILVIASGANRVDDKKINAEISGKIGRADPEFVRSKTGFVIGGVPPLGHLTKIKTFIDQDLLDIDQIWAADGTPYAVFKLKPGDMEKMNGGKIIKVA